jgi:hypothetical protein
MCVSTGSESKDAPAAVNGKVSTPTGGTPVLNQTLLFVAASIAFNNLRAADQRRV